jgi:hypothetical protein
MLRLPRRLVTALLWIAIALLPVRGWAAVLMPVMMQHSAVVSASDGTAPCHGQMQQQEAPAAAPGTCSMCDLCHTSVAQAPSAPPLTAVLHEPLPAAEAPTPMAPRAPDGLYRPPRTHLA